MPYNYLFDLEMLKSNKFELANAVVLVDQAHNIDQQAQEGCSFGLSQREVKECLRELSDLQRADNSKQNIELFRRPLQTLLLSLKNLQEGVTHLDSFQDLFQILKSMTSEKGSFDDYRDGLTPSNLQSYLQLGSKLFRAVASSPATDSWLNFLRKCLTISAEQSSNNFSIYSQRKQQGLINVYCLTSSLIFRHLEAMKPKSIILASGTLQPLKYWPQETSLEFPLQLTNESFIQSRHVYGCVLNNYRGQDFDFSYVRRSNGRQVECLVDVLNLIGKNTPNGVVVAFSSYQVYELVL